VVLNLQDDDFSLMGVKPGFEIDLLALETRWKQLQREVHPDKFATQGAAAQRVAMQWSVRVNEAYQRLKNPLQRAAYWCEQQGVKINAENNTAMPTDFLMQQMAWREALEEAVTEPDLEQLQANTQQFRAQLLQSLQQSIDADRNPSAAAQTVRGLMFVDKFVSEIHQRLERLDA
jgi:molecular chaperone HscB